MTTAIWWIRRDLRLQDNPALTAASGFDQVVPVFVFDDALLHGRHASGPRVAFMLECLTSLKADLQGLGADLVIAHGKPEVELLKLARAVKAQSLHFAGDVGPYARRRDHRVADALKNSGVEVHAHAGLTTIDNLTSLTALSSGEPYTVFSPFLKTWGAQPRRPILDAPTKLRLPQELEVGSLPSLDELKLDDATHPTISGGEPAAAKVLQAFYNEQVKDYVAGQNELGARNTSHLSAYLHFGVLSPRQVEDAAPPSNGSDAFIRQIAWRDFYQYILWHHPGNARHEFQARYRGLKWVKDDALLQAWQDGQTGYPLIDAGMRQLKAEGWMHNRARLAVGSFLTKDLGLDWREGERWFMHWLIDGDEGSNNGNWQWIASVGTDPAPLFRRLYNPTLHLKRYDPDFTYTRRYVPELKNVPDKYLPEPWTMPDEVQKQAGCIIGQDYPSPIVDHKVAREATIARYRV